MGTKPTERRRSQFAKRWAGLLVLMALVSGSGCEREPPQAPEAVREQNGPLSAQGPQQQREPQETQAAQVEQGPQRLAEQQVRPLRERIAQLSDELARQKRENLLLRHQLEIGRAAESADDWSGPLLGLLVVLSGAGLVFLASRHRLVLDRLHRLVLDRAVAEAVWRKGEEKTACEDDDPSESV